jgi:hypothetical protein
MPNVTSAALGSQSIYFVGDSLSTQHFHAVACELEMDQEVARKTFWLRGSTLRALRTGSSGRRDAFATLERVGACRDRAPLPCAALSPFVRHCAQETLW